MASCPLCAETIQGNETVCPHCGSVLRAAVPPAPIGRKKSPQRARAAGRTKILIIVAGVLVVLGIAGGVVWFLFGREEEPDFAAVVAMRKTSAQGPASAEAMDRSGATTDVVKLELFIMSKCPFGVKVMQSLAAVVEKMGENVDLRVDYIGRDKDGELMSMHGDTEVMGDILQLCARELGSFESWLRFVKCQDENWRVIPDGWESCAEVARLDVEKVKECADGATGKEFLRASFKRAEGMKVTGSPTIFLAGEPYKGGRSEFSFARALCAKLAGRKPRYCSEIPPPVPVRVTVVGDSRCTSRSCDTKRFLAFITNTFEGAEVKELDFGSPEGKALFATSRQKFLPIAVFGPEVEKEEAGYERLKKRLERIDATGDWLYPLGRDWDPIGEAGAQPAPSEMP